MMDALRIGKISSINYEKGTARVLYPDRDNAVTAELPYLTDYRSPEIDELVLVCHMPNDPAAGVILGPFWNDNRRPPEGAEGLHREDFDNIPDISFLRYDAKTGTLKIKAPNIEFEGSDGTLNITAPRVNLAGSGGSLNITAPNVKVEGSGGVSISAPNIALDGAVSGGEGGGESGEGGGGGGGSPLVSFETDETLKFEDGVLSVNTADVVEENNTLPVTSAAVQVTVGNIDSLLQTI